MKKNFVLLGSAILLLSMVFMQPSGLGYAQGEVPPTPSPTPYPGAFDFVTFDMLDQQDETLFGPYDSLYLSFGTPPSWVLEAGAKIVLEIETIVRSSKTTVEENPFSGAIMEVSFNDKVAQVIFLRAGVQTVEIPIPVDALQPTNSDGTHSLNLFLDATVDCLFDQETAVLVKSASGFSLPHHDVSPRIDLTLLPKQIYVTDSLLPEDIVILVPSAPTVKELKSAMIVSATLGRMMRGEQKISLASVDTISEVQKKNAHIIIVGQSGSVPLLFDIGFPAVPNKTNSDGVIQMAVSPWSASRVVLYIGGDEDDAVVKAAEAFSSGSLRVGKNNSLAVVSSVADVVDINDVNDERTLASLGYLTHTFSGIGYNSFEYEILIPLGKMPVGESSFDLIYTHSATFDFDSSGALILLNNEPVGSLRFSKETANQVARQSVHLPSHALRSGRNILRVVTEFIPVDYCATLNDTSLWMSISNESLFDIPLVPAEKSSASFVRDLGLYPLPFSVSPTLSETSFVLPVGNPAGWDIGAKVAANLGENVAGAILEVSAFYADDVPEEIRESQNLILIGRASQLPILGELTENMPAHFEYGNDMAVEDDLLITYNIPDGTDLGYLELFASPWNSARSMMAIMGSTPLGLTWAESALLNADARGEMQGDYVVVQGTKVYSVDTKASGLGTQNLSATAVPGSPPTAIPDNVPVASHAYQQNWVEVAVMVTSGAIILLLFGVIWRAFLKNRRK